VGGGERGRGRNQPQPGDLDVGAEWRRHVQTQLIAALDPHRLRLPFRYRNPGDEQHPRLLRAGSATRRARVLPGPGGLGGGLIVPLRRGQQGGGEGRDREQDEHDDDQSAGCHASSLGRDVIPLRHSR
jgi:hypothetical protein